MTKGLCGLAPRRKALRLTQEALAKALGIERGRLAMWESGVWPSAQWLPKIAEQLHCSVEDLYREPEEEARAVEGGGPCEDMVAQEEGGDHEA